ncbi:MAG: VOC family protein [Oscillospiraceae bacterium]|nr:VOC family protein [Oscillospiraceae bacterium]
MKDIALGIAHTAYNTPQMDKMLDFYCTKLGFKHAFTLKDDKGNDWIQYIKLADNTFIELFYSTPEKIKNGDSRYHHLCIRVNDINAVADYLKSKDIAITSGPSVGKDKNSQCWCADPDGNKIEFMCVSSESPQANA